MIDFLMVRVLHFSVLGVFSLLGLKNEIGSHMRFMTSGYLASVGRRHEQNFAHSIGKQRFPPESIGVYWTRMERRERKI